MTAQQTALLRELKPFSTFSAATTDRLTRSAKLLRYRVGQTMSDKTILPSQVLIILKGQARLIGIERGKPFTYGKLGPGAFVGLASLLRAGGCEQVTAAGDLLALAIGDRDVIRAFQEVEEFRSWCQSTVFPAEIASLAEELSRRSPRGDISLRIAFQRMISAANLIISTGGQISPGSNRVVLVSSANLPGLAVGDVVPEESRLPPSRPPLPARLMSLPTDLFHAFHHQLVASSAPSPEITDPELQNIPEEGSGVEPAPAHPLVSDADLGQYSPKSTVSLVRADGTLQEALACFQMLAADLGLPFRRDAIEKVLRDAIRRDRSLSPQLYAAVASMMGLHVTAAVVPGTMANRLLTPALVPWKEGVALLKQSNVRGMLLASPKHGWVHLTTDEAVEAYPDGINLLIVERTSSTPEQKFGLQWFMPSLRKYRGELLQVFTASFVVQLFTLANPLLIQVVIDKVISQRSLDTLQILGLALVVVTLVEAVLGSLRTFLLSETTNRIDTRLGAEVIDHLLRLPLGYFDQRPVGELASRIAELEKIREFLTGQGLTTILDAAFSVIYIVVMVLYSWWLTLIALAVLPIQVAIILLGAPLFRKQTRDVAIENARTQSHLVEVLSGIQTVKAQNVEFVSRWKWQDFYSSYISRAFEKTLTGTTLTQVSNMLQKLSQLLVLWVGASMVLKADLTLGQLIAFRIISGYVTQPLLRLTGIWQNIQELRVSFERLADVVDTPQESDEKDKNNIPLPSILGRVEFDNITFSFNPSGPPVLKNINLIIPAGTFVGVVGQSGSGKSTLMKLLPRLYIPQSGRILIDGYDVNKVELYSLRRQVGIVPQDPLLFSGSINENIALTDPDASSDAIVAAAQTACAHDFVMTLPYGYSSNVGERGSALSGGQRQRLAIARTLLSNPKLLVMDEATSALDYDTERRVCENLRERLKSCTVFFITHRLNTIRNADTIVMLHQGSVVEQGTHDELMDLRGRYYALYRQQEAS